MLRDLGEPIPSRKLRGKPSCRQPAKTKDNIQGFFPHFRVPSFGKHRQLRSGHPGSSARSQSLSGFRLHPGTCVWGGRHFWPRSIQGQNSGQEVCRVGQSTTLPSLADIQTSFVHLPAFPWSHPKTYPRERRAFLHPIILELGLCSTQYFVLPPSRLWAGNLQREKDAPYRGSGGGGEFTGYPDIVAWPAAPRVSPSASGAPFFLCPPSAPSGLAGYWYNDCP